MFCNHTTNEKRAEVIAVQFRHLKISVWSIQWLTDQFMITTTIA